MNITEIKIDMGHVVICDGCGADMTYSDESGGLLVGSYAYCPRCQGETEKGLRKYNEEYLIEHRCPEGLSFADWVRSLRAKADAAKA